MKNIVRAEKINNQTNEEQLKFYKEQFELIGCDRCAAKLHWGWVLYEEIPYCETCFELKRDEEINLAKKNIIGFEELIRKTKERYPEVNWEEEDES